MKKLLFMLKIKGVYENGMIRLEKEVETKKALPVIVTFLEDGFQGDTKQLTINDFSFLKAREISSSYKDCLSDAVIEERKSE